MSFSDARRRHVQAVDPKHAQMGKPCRFVRERLGGMGHEPVDHRARQTALAHGAQRLRVDHVILVPCPQERPQEREEGLAGLRPAGPEGREALAADVRGHPVASGMAGAGVVHRDKGRAREPGPQHPLVFLGKGLEVRGQEPHDLTL